MPALPFEHGRLNSFPWSKPTSTRGRRLGSSGHEAWADHVQSDPVLANLSSDRFRHRNHAGFGSAVDGLSHSPIRPASEPMETMRPYPRSIIGSSTARTELMKPHVSIAISRSHSSRGFFDEEPIDRPTRAVHEHVDRPQRNTRELDGG